MDDLGKLINDISRELGGKGPAPREPAGARRNDVQATRRRIGPQAFSIGDQGFNGRVQDSVGHNSSPHILRAGPGNSSQVVEAYSPIGDPWVRGFAVAIGVIIILRLFAGQAYYQTHPVASSPPLAIQQHETSQAPVDKID